MDLLFGWWMICALATVLVLCWRDTRHVLVPLSTWHLIVLLAIAMRLGATDIGWLAGLLIAVLFAATVYFHRVDRRRYTERLAAGIVREFGDELRR